MARYVPVGYGRFVSLRQVRLGRVRLGGRGAGMVLFGRSGTLGRGMSRYVPVRLGRFGR